MRVVKVVGLALLGLFVLVFFAGAFASELIGAYWPALGRRLAEFLR